MKRLLISLIVFSCLGLSAQDSITISGFFQNNTNYARVVIQQFGFKDNIVANAPIEDGLFSIKLPGDIQPGVYRLRYSQLNWQDHFDIIINGDEKTIHFEFDANNSHKQPSFIKSDENRIWYEYQAKSGEQLYKVLVLRQFLEQYPSDTDDIVGQAKAALMQERNNFEGQFENFKQENQATWACQMVANRPYVFTNHEDDPVLQDFYRKEHYWDRINTTDPSLINTPLYTEHILNYVRYYMNPDMQFSEPEMISGFKKSADVIMERFSGNEETQKFALDYITLGFKELGQEEVLQYIDETYRASLQCSDDTQTQSEFEKRMKGYEAMRVGNLAPNIAFRDNLENPMELYDIEAEQVLVVFWASWCPHCMSEMPKVNTWAKNNPSFKVLAISLDEDKAAYSNAIKNLTEMIHYSDFEKWAGQAVSEYFIYGTPTFILLDQSKRIIGKYSSFSGF